MLERRCWSFLQYPGGSVPLLSLLKRISRERAEEEHPSSQQNNCQEINNVILTCTPFPHFNSLSIKKKLSSLLMRRFRLFSNLKYLMDGVGPLTSMMRTAHQEYTLLWQEAISSWRGTRPRLPSGCN